MARDAGAYSGASGRFWSSLILGHALAWTFLALAGLSISKSCRTQAGASVHGSGESDGWEGTAHSYAIPLSLHSDPSQALRELLDRQPARWLAQRHRENRALIWLAVLMGPVLHLGFSLGLIRVVAPTSAGIFNALFLAVNLSSQLILAMVACRRMAEERASGALEVLLATPLGARQIVMGHWWGLWRLLRWPLLLATVLPQTVIILTLGQRVPTVAGQAFFFLLYQVTSAITGATTLVAVCWLAMWLAVRARSAARAAGLTVVWTMVVPYLAQSTLTLVFSFLHPANYTRRVPAWIYVVTLVHLFSGLTYSLGIVFWARHQLLTRLRDAILSSGKPLARRSG